MRDFPATPAEMVASLWRNRSLIYVLTKREVQGRYRGSVLGLLWSFFTPLFMLAVYTLVFSGVFKIRWGAGTESKTEFALVLYSGLLVFNLFAECINRAPGVILANPNYVKKVVFPLEILPFVGLLTAGYHLLISLGVWIVAYMFLFGTPHGTVLLFPLAILPFGLLILGMSWALASLGVFLRDVSQFTGLAITSLMFLSPIFYQTSALPENYRQLLYLNPLTPAIESIRDLLCLGKAPDPGLMAAYWLTTSAAAWLGFAWFQKTRKGFADVL